MKNKCVIILVLALELSIKCMGQQSDLRLASLEAIFSRRKVVNRFFFEYDTLKPFMWNIPAGKCALIFPDSIIRSVFPDIIERIRHSTAREQLSFTTLLLKGQFGSIFVSYDLPNPRNDIWIVFEEFTFVNANVNMKFVSTDYHRKPSNKKRKFYRVEAQLHSKNGVMHTTRFKMRRIKCCIDWDFFDESLKK
jgi:hypothetical protein